MKPMTASHFVERVLEFSIERPGDPIHRQEERVQRARYLAEELMARGARFDEDAPVELPALSIQPGEAGYRVVTTPGGFTARQAAEIVRRCEAWPELRRLAASALPSGSDVQDQFIALLDGLQGGR